MDAVDHRALFAAEGSDGNGGPFAEGEVVVTEDFPDEGFAGNSEEKGASVDCEPVERAEEIEVVGEGFSETDAGVVAEVFRRDSGGGESGMAFFEIGADFGDNVVVVRSDLHGARFAFHVHDDDAATGGGAEGGHFRISAETGDVVDDVRSGIERGAGDGGFRSVDGNEPVPFGTEGGDEGGGAADFLVGVDGAGTRAGGFAAHVDDSGTFGDHEAGMGEGVLKVAVPPSIGEGIRGGVEDSHDEGAAAEIDGTAAGFPNHVLELAACSREETCLGLPPMNRIANWKIAAACCVMFGGSALAGELDQVDGPNVRVMHHEDGGQTLFLRSPDKGVITKKTFGAGGNLKMVTIYRMDEHGNPLSCKIYDGQKTELFKVAYGYRKSDGMLVEERMFDSRVKRIDPADGKEMPVHRLMYEYDANGKRSAPISITTIPGRTAKDVFGIGPTGLDANPFAVDEGGVKPVNPSSRSVGR